MRALKRILCPLLLAVSVLSGCAVNNSKVGGFNLVSVQEEKQLGDQLATEIEKQQKVSKDPEAQALVDRVGKRLVAGVRKTEFPFTFQVVQDDNINAFAIPGGHTYVNTGLIKAADNETELAAVMAHEINHVVARHSTQQMTKQYGYQLIASLVLGQNQGQLAQIAAAVAGKAGTMYYSREMESQADYLGVETMYNAGYNPEGMATMFQKLQAVNQQSPSRLAQFFSSHPDIGNRIQDVRAEISHLPPKKYLPASSPEFDRVKAKLGK